MSQFDCADCGDKPFDLQVIVSSEDWECLADDGAYRLCYRCMNKRAMERGMQVKCSFVICMSNMRTEHGLPACWREPQMVEIDGSVGHPQLFGWKP